MSATTPGVSDSPAALPRHFYSLDALRGVAALAVVFFHWRQFYYLGTVDQNVPIDQFPLHAVLAPLYLLGHRAVDLFFCLSGFIFFWLYSTRIANREIGLREFWVLRFSRLYPLHFVTLLAMAAMQAYSLARHGSFQIFACNDVFHFGLQLFFASNWGFQRDFSFNAPIWSVSVEIVLYASFFVVCLGRFLRWWQLVLLAVGGFVFMRLAIWEIGRGLFSFFLGGLAFTVFLGLWQRRPPVGALAGLGATAAVLWVVLPWDAVHHMFHHLWQNQFHAAGGARVGNLILKFSEFSFELILFPLTLVSLALWEARRGSLGRGLRWLGNISYSSYLLHVPLQILFLLVVLGLGVNRDFFSTPLALGLYFAVLIALALLSYDFFERPMQSWLRAKLLPKPPAKSVLGKA